MRAHYHSCMISPSTYFEVVINVKTTTITVTTTFLCLASCIFFFAFLHPGIYTWYQLQYPKLIGTRVSVNKYQVFNIRPSFAANTKRRYLYSSQTRWATTFKRRPPGDPRSTCISIPRPYLRGVLYVFRRIYFVVRSTYVYVHTCLEEECRIINQSGSCTLGPLRPLYCYFPLNRRQIWSDIAYSPLFATSTKPLTS